MKKKPKPFNLESKIVVRLRQISRFWPPKMEAIKAAKKEDGSYQCLSCAKNFRKEYVRADHIKPVGKTPKKGDPSRPSWDEYISSMFCTLENFQVLCLDCHDAKTRREKKTIKSDHKER